MKRFAIAITACLALAGPTLADGKIYVQLPDLSSYADKRGEDFLYQIVLANVVSSNCADFAVTDEEWSLLTDSADILAHQLGIDTDNYDALYYKPAFDALDKPETCAEQGPNVQPVIDELVNQGGSREALPDQEKAYEDYRAMVDAWDAEAAQPKKSKTK